MCRFVPRWIRSERLFLLRCMQWPVVGMRRVHDVVRMHGVRQPSVGRHERRWRHLRVLVRTPHGPGRPAFACVCRVRMRIWPVRHGRRLCAVRCSLPDVHGSDGCRLRDVRLRCHVQRLRRPDGCQLHDLSRLPPDQRLPV